MNTNQIELSEEPQGNAYTITLAPDVVRYLHFTYFLEVDVEILIETLRQLCPQPTIRPPVAGLNPELNLEAIDALCPDENWDVKLRMHQKLGRQYFYESVPTYPYRSFHSGLMLKEYNFQEFTNSWVKDTPAASNYTLQRTFTDYTDHVHLIRPGTQFGYLFKKTPFVLARLAILPEETRKRDEEAKDRAKRLAELIEQEKARLAAEVEKEAKRQAAEEKEKRIRLLETKPYGSYYTITLAPGVVRYLELAVFLETDFVRWSELLRGSSPNPKFQSPHDVKEVDELFPNLTWEDRLRIHHALGRSALETEMPTRVYGCFHAQLNLKEFSLNACLEAWVKEAWNNYDVTESFDESSVHLVCSTSDERSRCVFKKTPFVVAQLTLLAKEAESQRENEDIQRAAQDLERLRKSHFQTYIYIMEDLRNGHFKIGQSKTPGKRERTLQAEVPQIALRLSIPADAECERELHDHFSGKRIRGEWFSLSADDLLWLVSFLKRNGDAVRVWMDYQWLGMISFSASNENS